MNWSTDDVAAVERLQHQHLADRRLGVARCRAEQQREREQASQHDAWESAHPCQAGMHEAQYGATTWVFSGQGYTSRFEP